MSYEPTNWKTGDVVTSAKLNKLENAVAGGDNFLVTFTNDLTGWVCDKTVQEIYEAEATGKIIYFYANVVDYLKSYTTTYQLVAFEEDGATITGVEIFFIFFDSNENKRKIMDISYYGSSIASTDIDLTLD